MDPRSNVRRWIIKAGMTAPVALAGGCSGTDGSNASAGLQPVRTSAAQVSTPQQTSPLFLSEAELKTLEALVDNIVPADDNPGAKQARCARGIQFLLSAFSFSPAMIFAGGPFSDRGGNAVNHFQNFIPLDPYEELAWRIKIEGSKGMPERSFNGTVKGWQAIYREGLAALNASAAQAGGSTFESLPSPAQALILNDSRNAAITELVSIATPHTLELMYGAPEYGGNADLAGWGFTNYEGDVQPRGYTRQQVVEPENPSAFDLLGLSRRESADRPGQARVMQAALLPVPTLDESLQLQHVFHNLIAMTSDEFGLAMMIDGQSDERRIRQFVQSKLPRAKRST